MGYLLWRLWSNKILVLILFLKTIMVEEKTKSNVPIGLAIGATVGVTAPLVATAALEAAGFSAAGVVAGSTAAATQASIGNVAAGSLFAMCQSVGAAGFASSTVTGVAAGATGIGGLIGGLWPDDEEPDN